MNIQLTNDSVKSMAKALRDFLATAEIELNQSNAYGAIAKIAGYENWNILSAKLKSQSNPQESSIVNGERETSITLSRYWPSAARGLQYCNKEGNFRHKVLTSQAPSRDGRNSLCFEFPSLQQDPESLKVPISGQASDSEMRSLLSLMLSAVASVLRQYVEANASPLETGSSTDGLHWHVWNFPMPGISDFKIVTRVLLKGSAKDARAELMREALQVADDLDGEASRIQPSPPETLNEWLNLSRHGPWVRYALRLNGIA